MYHKFKDMEDIQLKKSFNKLVDEVYDEACRDFFDTLNDGDVSFIKTMPGMKERINNTIEHFSGLEEYEKCSFLSNLIKKYNL